MPRTTLKDVADRVGVSAKTVSNVVNGTGWVTDDLQRRVRAAIEELGYRPNAARSEEHTSELQSLMRISYDVFCLKKKRRKKPICTYTYMNANQQTHETYSICEK